jgi:glycosyltransferase involved in cell wall biosynthesis
MRSVVLAACNGEQYIGAQLDSIMAQLASDDEVIVSDDASSDGTVHVVEQRNDPRIQISRNSNRVGYVKNFERAVLLARHDRIIFSDQDDLWLPNKVRILCSALDRKACAVSDAIVVDKDLNELHPSFFKLRRASNFDFSAVFAKPCFIGATMACRKAYLHSLLPFPPHVPHDFWVTLNAIWDHELEVVMDPLILYRRHPTTASVSASALKRRKSTIFMERFRILTAMLKRRSLRLATL